MVIYAIVCSECGAERVGRDRDGEVEPFRRECADCGCSDFEVPAGRKDG